MKYRALVAYDGSGYNGFQSQKNGVGIQDIIQNCLTKIHRKPTSITASGRTDAGVHATGQVFHFEGNEAIGSRGYYNALNTLLPKDIRIRALCKAPSQFHARFSAIGKEYEYVLTKEKDNPFSYRYKTQFPHDAEMFLLQKAADQFVGEHDFTSFTNAKIHPDKPRVKRIDSIRVIQDKEDIRIVFQGNGFLRYQIRMMMAVILRVAQRKLSPEDISKMIEAKHKDASRWNAPAQGLYLKRAIYPKEMEEACYEFYPEESKNWFQEGK